MVQSQQGAKMIGLFLLASSEHGVADSAQHGDDQEEGNQDEDSARNAQVAHLVAVSVDRSNALRSRYWFDRIASHHWLKCFLNARYAA